jgi:hypothetical protein
MDRDEPAHKQVGQAHSKSEAAEEAGHMIDVMLAAKKRQLIRSVSTN